MGRNEEGIVGYFGEMKIEVEQNPVWARYLVHRNEESSSARCPMNRLSNNLHTRGI